MRTRRLITTALVAAVGAALFAGNASAQQVTGLTVTQGEGFATLAWNPVAGATDYQIERATVTGGVPGTGTIVGLWQAQRTIRPSDPRFADAGFALGGTYQWRVRARLGSTNPQPYSDPVIDTTRPQWGNPAVPGENLRTQWESSGNATYTSYANELIYTDALVAASPRVRYVEIGRTNPCTTASCQPGNRAINLLIFGYPTPKATPEEISATPTIMYNCNVHGNEPQGRESCFIFARMLAFTQDPELLEILSNVNVLMVPSINGNGRHANIRGNETGADLNRDHAELLQPETRAFARALRDYTPDVSVDLHEGDTEDLPVLTSRHLNVHQPLFSEGKNELVEGWLYNAGADTGWWYGPYNNGGDSHEGILRNTLGLKSSIGLLAENRASGGTTRPAEGTQLANRNRKSYGSLDEEFQVLHYFWTNLARITSITAASEAFQKANVGRVVLRGSYPWPYNPLLGANTGIPDTDNPLASRIIDPAPCAYFLTYAAYNSSPGGGFSVGNRFIDHGIAADERRDGVVTRLAQRLRGLIPVILDSASASPSPIVAGTRLFECPHVDLSARSFDLAAVAGTSTSASLAISNIAPEVDEPLNWTITEAATSCASPSDVPWLSVDSAAGSTPSAGGVSSVEITASAADLAAPVKPTALLCLQSNDSGEALIAIPVSFQVQYAFTGFFSPILNPPALNSANAGSTSPVKFVVEGGSGISIVGGGSPQSRQIDCATFEPLGPATPITTPGTSGFVFDPVSYAYQANWKTEKSWAGTCRELILSLDDDTTRSAFFSFS